MRPFRSPEEWLKTVQYVSADGIYQNKENQEKTKKILDAKLLSPINPRKIKDKQLDVRGITKLDRYGVPHCLSDYSHMNVPLLPSFLPVIATMLTTCCQHLYQWVML